MAAAERVIIDANVAIGLAAAGTLTRFASSRTLLAPVLFWSEVRSALHAEGRRSGELAACERMFRHILETDIEPLRVRDELAPWRLAGEQGWAKTYDAEYLVLAIEQGAALATVDRQLVRAARDRGIELVPITL